jgi:hypothetical protein
MPLASLRRDLLFRCFFISVDHQQQRRHAFSNIVVLRAKCVRGGFMPRKNSLRYMLYGRHCLFVDNIIFGREPI